MAQRAVVARGFPAAWATPNALGTLPHKVQMLLRRIGELDGPPTVSTRPPLQVIARFQTAAAAAEAVRMLHGTDLRTKAEKEAVNHAPPKDSERFWLQFLEETVLAPSAPRRVAGTVVALAPLPSSWGESDVIMLASPYGKVQQVRIEASAHGRAALVDFLNVQKAQSALTGWNGLTLAGQQLRCWVQEQERQLLRYLVCLDELPMPSRPEVEPRLDDRELFLELRKDIDVRELAEVLELRQLPKEGRLVQQRQAYCRCRSTAEALKLLKSTPGTAQWSESERACRGVSGVYGLDLFGRLQSRLEEIQTACGAASLSLQRPEPRTGSTEPFQQAVFAICCEQAAQAEECKRVLALELQKLHELFTREVQGSLVLRGFPASWSERSLKFVFAPFGGLASVVLVEGSPRLAYVKLRNSAAMSKAVTNLHRTKVGDGDLVEECVVECQRWHSRAWSLDGAFHVSIFVDQLAMGQRPDLAPKPADRELFVRNLPLQDMSQQQLQEYFEGFGEVEDLYLIRDTVTLEPMNEGYVRFRQHADAVRCIEALTPEDGEMEADASDLVGTWSESERVLQRKASCYHFNLLAELIASDGSGLEHIKEDAAIRCVWVLADSLKQRDLQSPPPNGRQLHFVARCTDEAQLGAFRQILERAVAAAHRRIGSRARRRALPPGAFAGDALSELIAPKRRREGHL